MAAPEDERREREELKRKLRVAFSDVCTGCGNFIPGGSCDTCDIPDRTGGPLPNEVVRKSPPTETDEDASSHAQRE